MEDSFLRQFPVNFSEIQVLQRKCSSVSFPAPSLLFSSSSHVGNTQTRRKRHKTPQSQKAQSVQLGSGLQVSQV